VTFSSTSHSIGGLAGQALGCVETVREAGEDLGDELISGGAQRPPACPAGGRSRGKIPANRAYQGRDLN